MLLGAARVHSGVDCGYAAPYGKVVKSELWVATKARQARTMDEQNKRAETQVFVASRAKTGPADEAH